MSARPSPSGTYFSAPATSPPRRNGLVAAGLRRIAGGKRFAVLELRGGTHLVVTKAARPPRKGTEAPFDLMVDDVDAARRTYAKHGFKPSRITRGSIHDRFAVTGPDGYRFEIVSSHVGKRAV